MSGWCSTCGANGRRSKIRPFQINLEEAIMMCANPKCLDSFNAAPIILKRKARRNDYKPVKRKSQQNTLDSECLELDQLLNMNPDDLPVMDESFQDLFNFNDNDSILASQSNQPNDDLFNPLQNTMDFICTPVVPDLVNESQPQTNILLEPYISKPIKQEPPITNSISSSIVKKTLPSQNLKTSYTIRPNNSTRVPPEKSSNNDNITIEPTINLGITTDHNTPLVPALSKPTSSQNFKASVSNKPTKVPTPTLKTSGTDNITIEPAPSLKTSIATLVLTSSKTERVCRKTTQIISQKIHTPMAVHCNDMPTGANPLQHNANVNSKQTLLYPLWTNSNALCWLDSLLCLIVNIHSIRNESEKLDFCIRKLLDTYDYCWKMCNTNPNSGQNLSYLMTGRRDEIYKFLQPALKNHFGQEDNPWFALLALLSIEPRINEMFKFSASWEGTCAFCGLIKNDRKRETPLSFPFVPKSFGFPDNVTTETICTKCSASGLKLKLRIINLPKILAVQFCNGLQDNKIAEYDFSSHGQNCKVIAVIQYDLKLKHFVTWIRNWTDETWLCCDDLKSPSVSYFEVKALQFPVHEIHAVFWESNPVPHPFQWKDVQLNDIQDAPLIVTESVLTKRAQPRKRIKTTTATLSSSSKSDQSNASDGDMNIVGRGSSGGYKSKTPAVRGIRNNIRKEPSNTKNGKKNKKSLNDSNVADIMPPKTNETVKGLLNVTNLFMRGF